MPFIRVTIPDHISSDATATLASSLTTLATNVLRKPAHMTSVTFVRVREDEYYIAGKSVTDAPGVHVEVSLTVGTNSAEERRAFIAGVSDALVDVLGAGATLRGVALTEYLPESYGYEGITQYERNNQEA